MAARVDEPSQLRDMLAKYEAMPASAERDRFAVEIDHYAGQRYATVSKLFWYRDLESAKQAAAALHRPILHLRMLGKLDEDLSCANSRFFRATLYANADTSKFLRENFILYWSSERPVPRLTIDFGDGRKLERTTTGNSAHYVLDERGNVLDVLPGLYAPSVFRSELAKSLELAKAVREKYGDELLAEVLAFHQRELAAAAQQIAPTVVVDDNDLARAQRVTYTKSSIERRDLRTAGFNPGSADPGDTAQWASFGRRTFRLPGKILDAQSLELVDTLRTGNPRSGDRARVVARLEQHIMADTALDQFRLRAQIRRHITTSKTLDFASLNDWIYRVVFATPKDDIWLGLLDSADFTGLPGDGVVTP
jgi:hypothetical protein